MAKLNAEELEAFKEALKRLQDISADLYGNAGMIPRPGRLVSRTLTIDPSTLAAFKANLRQLQQLMDLIKSLAPKVSDHVDEQMKAMGR